MKITIEKNPPAKSIYRITLILDDRELKALHHIADGCCPVKDNCNITKDVNEMKVALQEEALKYI